MNAGSSAHHDQQHRRPRSPSTVNAAGGGTGNANIRAISAWTTAGPAGGRITIATHAGAIVDADASATVNLIAGNAILTAAGGIGTAADAIETTLGNLEAMPMAAAFGITTLGDDVRLTVAGDLVIDNDIDLGLGNLLLEVGGSVSQNAGDTIVAGGLALDVNGTTTLTEANNNVSRLGR